MFTTSYLLSALVIVIILYAIYRAHGYYKSKQQMNYYFVRGEKVKSCRVMIHNKWYDLAKYLNTFSHPGGNKLIQQFENSDCTVMFTQMHPNNSKDIINMILPKYLINTDKDTAIANIDHYNNDRYFNKSPELLRIKKLFLDKVNHIDFPCVCGKTSILTKQAKFAIIDDVHFDLNDLPLIIIDYMLQQQMKWKLKPKKYFSSLVIFFTNIQHSISSKSQFEKYVLQCFEILKDFEREMKDNKKDGKNKVNLIEKDTKVYPLYKSTLRFCGRTFFLATMNKYETRAARHFAVPALVFNTIEEFDMIGNEFPLINKIITQRLKKYKI